MELEKYKVCPSCGEHNRPTSLECRKCETDLTGVRVVDSETEQREAAYREGAASFRLRLYEYARNAEQKTPRRRESVNNAEKIFPIFCPYLQVKRLKSRLRTG